MRWIILLLLGIVALSAIFFYWTHFPVIGVAGALGYFCGAMRWKGVQCEQNEDTWGHFGGGSSQR